MAKDFRLVHSRHDLLKVISQTFAGKNPASEVDDESREGAVPQKGFNMWRQKPPKKLEVLGKGGVWVVQLVRFCPSSGLHFPQFETMNHFSSNLAKWDENQHPSDHQNVTHWMCPPRSWCYNNVVDFEFSRINTAKIGPFGPAVGFGIFNAGDKTPEGQKQVHAWRLARYGDAWRVANFTRHASPIRIPNLQNTLENKATLL